MDDLTLRATKLYRQSCKLAGQAAESINERSGAVDALGGRYIVLRGDNGILCVYVYRAGKLNSLALQNWPQVID